MKRFLVPLVKLLLVAGLMWWVFATIQLEDTLAGGAGASGGPGVLTGKVVSPLDQPTIEFLVAGESEPRLIPPSESVRVEIGLLTYWRNMSVSWFLLGALCYLVNVVFASTRWWWLLRVNRLPISFWAAFRFTWMGLFFNNVVPGQTGGDLVKAIYVMKRCHGERVPAMMSVVVDRIMGLASLSILAAIAVLFYLGKPGFDGLALVLWGILGGLIMLGAVAFSRRLRALIRLKPLFERLPEKIGSLLKRIDHAVFFYRQHKVGMGWWMLAGMINHVFSVLSYACVGIALGVGMPVQDYFVLVPVIVTISAIPISPNGWGIGDAMFTLMFGKYGAVHVPGVSPEVAARIMGTRGATLSIVYRIHLTLWSLLGGVMYFFDKDKVTRAEMAAEVEREEVEEAEIDAEMQADENAAAGRA